MSRNLRFISMSMAALFFLAMSLGAESAGGAAAEKDIAGITKRIYPSVVRVEARNGTRRIATGVVIDKDGHILTTALISPRDEKITVITATGSGSTPSSSASIPRPTWPLSGPRTRG